MERFKGDEHGVSTAWHRSGSVLIVFGLPSNRSMFEDVQSFNADISGWDVGQVTDMEQVCRSFW